MIKKKVMIMNERMNKKMKINHKKIIVQQKTKLLSFLLVAAMLMGIFTIVPMSASAAEGSSFSDEQGLQYVVIRESLLGNAVRVTGYTGDSDSVNIPSTVKNDEVEYTVEEIGASAFSDKTTINSITLNSGLLNINSSAFAKCTGLIEINFPATLTQISATAFNGCSALTKITFNSDAKVLALAFNGCAALADVYCYGSPNFTGTAFGAKINTDIIFHYYQGSSVENYVTEKGFKSEVMTPATPDEPTTSTTAEPTEPDMSIFKWQVIQNGDDGEAVVITGLKDGYTSMEDVEISSEINGRPVIAIADNAFSGLRINNLTIPASVRTIGSKAFFDCRYLKSVTFEEESQLTSIASEAFALTAGQGGDTLGEIHLPASLKNIAYRAFYQRNGLGMIYVESKDVVFGDDRGKEIFGVFSEGQGSSVVKLYGYEGSTTEAYANEVGHTFRIINLDTAKLQETIDKADELLKNESKYTAASYATLKSATTDAKRTLNNKNSKQADIDSACKTLEDAIAGLVEAGDETTATTNGTEPSSASEYVDVLIGDTNGDGRISVQDATAIQAHIVNLSVLEGVPYVAADVNEDERITVIDATLVQKYIVDQIEEGNHTGVTAKKPLPDKPQPTNPPTPTEPPANRFYMPNYVKWLNEYGAKIWIYNNATDAVICFDNYDEDTGVYYTDNLPDDWTNISFFRTPLYQRGKEDEKIEVSEEDFRTSLADFKETGQVYSDDHPDTYILNVWQNLADRGDANCFKVVADGVGSYTTYDPALGDDETERTIYFDNSKTQWSQVHFYSWSYAGIRNESLPMEFEGNDIWSITIYEELPVDGIQGFLFVSQDIPNGTDESCWNGARQTGDLATEAGKNIFIASTTLDNKNHYTGSWGVYNPETGEIIS